MALALPQRTLLQMLVGDQDTAGELLRVSCTVFACSSASGTVSLKMLALPLSSTVTSPAEDARSRQ